MSLTTESFLQIPNPPLIFLNSHMTIGHRTGQQKSTHNISPVGQIFVLPLALVCLHSVFHWPFLFCILLHFAVQCSPLCGEPPVSHCSSACRSHCVPCCPSVSISASRRCLWRTPFEALHCSTSGFCTLIPGSFYTSSPFQGSSAYPQTWKPLHTSKSIVLYTAQVLPSLQILCKMWQ